MKIHFLSNSLRMNSGFGNVAKYLAVGLKKLGHEVTMSGMQTGYCSDFSYGIEQLPIDTKYVDELTQFMLNIRTVNPDVVFFVGQMDMDSNHFTKVFGNTIVYCPVEGRDIPDMMSRDLLSVEKKGGKVVGQCKYGQDEMRKVGVNAGMIYHGYNDSIFKKMDTFHSSHSFHPYCYYATSVGQNESDPIWLCKNGCYDCHYNCYGNTSTKDSCLNYKEEKVNILRMIDGKWAEKEIGISKLKDETSTSASGKFVYGHVGINFGIRKRQERLIRAYAIMVSESKQLRDRTILHMHCKPMSINGVNLIREVAKLGVSENVIFSYGGTRSNAWTEEGLNVLYNTFDCHVSASSSEGFGLAHLESLACGIPNIAPNCSSFPELIGDGERGEKGARGLLALVESWQMVPDGSYRALVNEEHLATMMKKMYVDKKCRERFSSNGIEWAKSYTWDKIVLEWNKLLKEMV